MANPFDQFDEPKSKAQANPFDQFDNSTNDFGARIDFGGDTTPQPQPERSLADKAIGVGEAALSTLTGMTSGAVGGIVGTGLGVYGDLTNNLTPEQAQALMAEEAARWTYQPRTDAGQDYVKSVGEVLGALPATLAAGTPLQGAGALGSLGATAKAAGLSKPSLPRPAITDEAILAADYAKKNDLPITTSDVLPTTSRAGQAVQVIGEQTPIAGTGGLRGAQQEARSSLLQTLQEETPEITDQALSASLSKSANDYTRVIGKRYEDIRSRMADSVVPKEKTIKAIDDEIARISQKGTITDTELLGKLRNIKEDLSAGEQTFSQFRDNRTLVREKLKSETSNTQADRAIDRIYDAMTDDIQSAVKSTLGDRDAFRLKQADALFRNEIVTQKKTKLRKALIDGEVKPEEAAKVLFSNSPSDVRELYTTLNKEGRANARAAIINRALEKADGSPEKFLSTVRKYETQFDTFFKGADKAKLDGLIAYLNTTRRAAKATVDTPTGQRQIPVALAALFGADVGSGGTATASVASIAGLARLYESAPVRNALIRLAKTNPKSTDYDKAYLAVDAAIKSQAAQEKENE